MVLKLPLRLISKIFTKTKKQKKKNKTKKQRREIHTYNTMDSRFDKAFYF